jgi:hypothetical protein
MMPEEIDDWVDPNEAILQEPEEPQGDDITEMEEEDDD